MNNRPPGYQQPADWRRTRARILTRDPLCQLAGPRCTRHSTTVDHRTPVAEGGTHDEANLQGACQTCHDAKSETERRRGITRRARHRPNRRGHPSDPTA